MSNTGPMDNTAPPPPTPDERRTEHTLLVDVPTELGPYRLTRLLGRGGMGEVWLGFDTKLEREVAVKLMRKELLANEEAVKRFYREARAVARLNHPNIVQVYSIGDEHGVIYFVMELVDGETVTDSLKRENRLPVEEAVGILLQTIEGLSYAHARGIIHRDIKPSNLMLTREHRVKIADFGLAKMLETDTQMTASGVAMGSPNYMSPEQARGEEADHRSDIYALGISFYQMLLGELPFTAPTPLTVLLKQIQDPLPEPDELAALADGRVLQVIRKMTSKDPEERYQTYGGLAAAVGEIAPQVMIRPSAHIATATMAASPMGSRATPDASPIPTTGDGSDASPRFSRSPSPPPLPGTQPTGRKAFPSAVAAGIGVGIVAVIATGAGVFFWMRPGAEPAGPNPSTIATPTPTARVHPSPSPVVSPTPVTTPAAATAVPAQPPAVIPTAAPVITGSQTPAATSFQAIGGLQSPVPAYRMATPTVAATPAETPPPPEIVLGPDNPLPGTTVAFLDESGATVASIPAGTRLPLLRMIGSGTNAAFVARYQGRQGFVRYSDARTITPGVGSAAASATGDPGAVAPAGLQIRLGTRGGKADEQIVVYSDKSLKREVTRLPAGTVLPAEEQKPIGYSVGLPNGRRGFVVLKDATPLP